MKYVIVGTIAMVLAGCALNPKRQPVVSGPSKFQATRLADQPISKLDQTFLMRDLHTGSVVRVEAHVNPDDTGKESVEVSILDASNRKQVSVRLSKIYEIEGATELSATDDNPTAIIAKQLDEHGTGYNKWSYSLISVIDGKPTTILNVPGDFSIVEGGIRRARIAKLVVDDALEEDNPTIRNVVVFYYDEDDNGRTKISGQVFRFDSEKMQYKLHKTATN